MSVEFWNNDITVNFTRVNKTNFRQFEQSNRNLQEDLFDYSNCQELIRQTLDNLNSRIDLLANFFVLRILFEDFLSFLG